MTSDYDQRQYEQMLLILRSYQAGQLGLGRAIADLEALQSCLQVAQDAWKKSFQSEWGVLEDVYASMLDKGLDELPLDLQNLVNIAVTQLQGLVTDEVNKGREWSEATKR